MNSTASWIRVWLPVTIAAAVLLINRQLIPASAQAPVRFAGPTIQIPARLRGPGEVAVVFTIDGLNTNPVTISMQ